MTIYIQKAKGQLHCGNIILCKNALSGQYSVLKLTNRRGDCDCNFHIWLDTEFGTQILGVHPETGLIV